MQMMMDTTYIKNIQEILVQYKKIAEAAMVQVEDKRFFWVFNNNSNSIAILIQHLHGNMISRFTNFYEEDGEKPWRNRDREFEPVVSSREELMDIWESGWECLFQVVNHLHDLDLGRTVYVGGKALSVLEALNRQVVHYSYHIGQIVFLSKMLATEEWKSLSIPKKKS